MLVFQYCIGFISLYLMRIHLYLYILYSLIPFLFISPCWSQGLKQDTIRMTLKDAEQIFLQKNMELLAAKYNVDVQKALIMQAKLYPNPNLSLSQGIYNTETHKYFQTGAYTGETSAQLQQLILLAGKRKKQTAMAETNALLAEDAFYDLMRTLKYTLRSDFFSIYYLQQTGKVYNEEINALKQVVAAGEKQLEKGYIAKTELVRDQAQLYSLQSELNDMKNQINDKESEVRIIIDSIATGTYIIPVIDTGQILSSDPMKYTLVTLLDSAERNRTDLRSSRDNFVLSKQNYNYQKALAVPDITIGTNYDQNGSYIHNFTAFNIGFDLPVFNRNQGNIKAGKYQINSNEAGLQAVQHHVEEGVFRALEMAITQYKLYHSLDKNFTKEFDALAKEILSEYMKRNIGLLDFLTFYDSYKQNIVQLNNILAALANSYVNIDYMTGTDFFYK